MRKRPQLDEHVTKFFIQPSPFRPRKNKNAKLFFLDLADNDMTAMAQLTRAITNHAPTGEYYVARAERFPDKEMLCTNCSLAVIQTHRHILTECTKYTNHFPSIRFWANLLGLRPSHNPSLTEKRENRDETIKVVITT